MKLATTTLVIASLVLGATSAHAATSGTVHPMPYDELQTGYFVAFQPEDESTPVLCEVSGKREYIELSIYADLHPHAAMHNFDLGNLTSNCKFAPGLELVSN